MKLFSPDGSELMHVEKVEAVDGNIVVQGKIMGAMPMKAILRPQELRSGMRFLSFGLIKAAFSAIVLRRSTKK